MNSLSVVIRKDLSMPRGKMGAQAAHGAMKLFLDGLSLTGIPFLRSLPSGRALDYKLWSEQGSLCVIMVKNEEGLREALPTDQHSAIIIDNGRTHFNGQKTLTCAAFGLYQDVCKEFAQCEDIERTEKARQYFLISDEFNVTKPAVCEITIRSCLGDLFTHMQAQDDGSYELHLTPGTPRADWLGGAFTKICLRVDSNAQLLDKAEQLIEKGFSITHAQVGEFKGFCVEPSYSDDIRPLVEELRPLMGW